MIVVDASTVTYVLAVEQPAGSVHVLLAAEEELHAPHLVDLEVMASLRGLVAGRKLDQADARSCLDALSALPIVRYTHVALRDRVWELRHNLTPYDAVSVALAEALDASLVTGDRAIAAAPGVRCPVQIVG